MRLTRTLLKARYSHSYVHGASPIPFLRDTMSERLRLATDAVPDKTLFYFHEQRLRKTYQQFYQDCRSFASSLIHLGLRGGDRVGAWGPNYYEWLVCQYATAMAGMIQVNINPSYKIDELRYALNKVEVSCVVTPKAFKSVDYHGMLEKIVPEMKAMEPGNGAISSKEVPSLKHVIVFEEAQPVRGAWNFSSLSSDSSDMSTLDEWERKVRPDDPVNIQFTSGTTGSPKAATLSHNNIVNNAYLGTIAVRKDEGSHTVCLPLPLYHCFGCVIGALGVINHQHTAVFPSPRFDAAATLEAIEQERCNWMYGTPAMFIDLIGHPNAKTADISSLTSAIMGGAPCPLSLCERLVFEYGIHNLCNAYGMTETSPALTISRLSDEPMTRVQSVGHVLPHAELEIVDDEGHVVERGEKGQLRARGYMVMLGYWNDEEKTRKEINQEGWYHTGDTAIMNDDGSIGICGRSKELIIRGGENIYPAEIENVIHGFDYVADVQVIGIPDERLGEKVCAWIVLQPGQEKTEDDVKKDVKEKIATYKVPEFIVFKKEGEFPMTATGKVQKFRMVEITKEMLGIQD